MLSWITGSKKTPPPQKEVQSPEWTWVTHAVGGRKRVLKSMSATKQENRPMCPPLLHASHTPSTEKDCVLVVAGDLPALEKYYRERGKRPLGEMLFRKFSRSPEAGVRTPSSVSTNLSEKKKKHKSHKSKSHSKHGLPDGDLHISSDTSEKKHHHKSRSHSKKKSKDKDETDMSVKNASSNDSGFSARRTGSKGSSLGKAVSNNKANPSFSRHSSRASLTTTASKQSTHSRTPSKAAGVSCSRHPSKDTATPQIRSPSIASLKNAASKEHWPHKSAVANEDFSKQEGNKEKDALTTRPPRSPSPQRVGPRKEPTPLNSVLLSNKPSTQGSLSQRSSSVGPASSKGSKEGLSTIAEGGMQTPPRKRSSNHNQTVSSGKPAGQSILRKVTNNAQFAAHSPRSRSPDTCPSPPIPSAGRSKSPTPKTPTALSSVAQTPKSLTPTNSVAPTPRSPTPLSSVAPTSLSSLAQNFTGFTHPDNLSSRRKGKPNPPLSKRGRSERAAKNVSENAGSDKSRSRSRSSGRVSQQDDFEDKGDQGSTLQEALGVFFEVNKRAQESEWLDRGNITGGAQNTAASKQTEGCTMKKTCISTIPLKNKPAQSSSPTPQKSSPEAPPPQQRTPQHRATPITPPHEHRTPTMVVPQVQGPRGAITPPLEQRALASPELQGRARSGSLQHMRREQSVSNNDRELTQEEKSHDLISRAIANDSELAKRAGPSFQSMIGRILSHDPTIFRRGSAEESPRPAETRERKTQITRQTRKQVTQELEMKGRNKDGEEHTTVYRFQEQGCRIQHQDSANPEKNVDQTMTRNVRSVTQDGATTRRMSPISTYRQQLDKPSKSQADRLSPSLWDGRMSPTPINEKLRQPRGRTQSPLQPERMFHLPQVGDVSPVPGDQKLKIISPTSKHPMPKSPAPFSFRDASSIGTSRSVTPKANLSPTDSKTSKAAGDRSVRILPPKEPVVLRTPHSPKLAKR